MNYVDGFVTPVPSANKEAYLAHAKTFAQKLKDAGALGVTECWGDDVPEGKVTSFGLAVKRESTETVVFSWITWPSRAVRDAAWAKLMADPAMAPGATPIPYDGKRLIYGGFQVIMEA